MNQLTTQPTNIAIGTDQQTEVRPRVEAAPAESAREHGDTAMTHDETAAYLARHLEADARETNDPAATLTRMRETLPALLANAATRLGYDPALDGVLLPLVDHRLKCMADIHGLFPTLTVEQREPYGILLDALRRGADPIALGERVLELLAQARAETSAVRCPVFRDCDVTGPHCDHSAHDVLQVLDERDTSTVLSAGMVALSGADHGATVCLGIAEYTDATALKAKTQELRRFLDEVDALADRVFTDHQARG